MALAEPPGSNFAGIDPRKSLYGGVKIPTSESSILLVVR